MKETNLNNSPKMTNHIEEYFAESSQSKEVITSKELFRANPEDLDIKTDVDIKEIVLVNKLMFNNDLLKQHGLDPVYKDFLRNYLRLKISKDRKSRGEFVDMNRGSNKADDVIDTMSKINNITNTKK